MAFRFRADAGHLGDADLLAWRTIDEAVPVPGSGHA
jgi:hypothetical protein